MTMDVGDAIQKIKSRPPIEYLRKLAPSPEVAAQYLKDMERAELVKLSELGARAQQFEVYVPLLGKKLAYGLPGLNEIIEWQEAALDLGEDKIDPSTGKVIPPSPERKRKIEIDKVKATRKIAYLMLRKADPDLAEEAVGNKIEAAALTQFIIAAGTNTPFLGAAVTPEAASPSPSPLKT
jgi:hypothetical protein